MGTDLRHWWFGWPFQARKVWQRDVKAERLEVLRPHVGAVLVAVLEGLHRLLDVLLRVLKVLQVLLRLWDRNS